MKIPDCFLTVKYVGARTPGVENQSDLKLGANCQVFAYELLRVNGLVAPKLRSSELWSDTQYTIKVSDFQPLDLMLYNSDNNAFGAHVGVYIGDGKIIHLSYQNQYAEIIDHIKMSDNEKYRVFIGAKRVLTPSSF